MHTRTHIAHSRTYTQMIAQRPAAHSHVHTDTRTHIHTHLTYTSTEVSAQNKQGETPLHIATIEGNEWMVLKLISAGADVLIGECTV